jgi:[acyl-carrier-protein] S-malonyltransferase
MHQTTAFVFPGQGSQYIGMLMSLYKEHNVVREVFSSSSDVLGYDLWKLIQQGPIEKLNQTEFTQPALLAAGVAMWRTLEFVEKLLPNILAGHSLGEYTALVCAGALDLNEALLLVTKRGQLMQSAVASVPGAMAAILGLADEEVIEICNIVEEDSKQIVQPANFNCPGQVVIAGITSAVNSAINLAKNRGAKKTILLPISVPSHCILMKPIAEQFANELNKVTWTLPKISVLHNFDAKIHKDIENICYALEQQLCSPVRWVETIQNMAKMGIKLIAECGPGKVLTSLNKRINKDLQYIALEEYNTFLEQPLAEKA